MAASAAVILLDTNLLVYAHRAGTTEHSAAKAVILRACRHAAGCGVAGPTIAEFLSVVTHPTSSGRPSRADEASAFLRVLFDQGGVQCWGLGPASARRVPQLAADLGVCGARVLDLQIALCGLEAGASELWTHDRNFVAVPGLRIVHPLHEHVRNRE